MKESRNSIYRKVVRFMQEDNIGQLIAAKRKQLGLSQRNIANFVGVTEATVSRWESGEIGNMRRDRIAKLAEALNLSPLTLMGIKQDLLHTDAPSEFSRAVEKEHVKAGYYRDTAVAELAQELKENPDLRVLLDASRGLKKESLEEVKRFVEYQKMRENGL